MPKKRNIEFWSRNTSSNSKNKYNLNAAHLSDWLELRGYYRINNYGTAQVIKLKNNIVTIKSPLDVYNDVLKFIKKQKDDDLRNSFTHQGENLILSKKATLGSLPILKKDRYRDSISLVRLFYENIVIVVGANSIEFETYKDFKKLNKYIFSDQIIERTFIKVKKGKSEFAKFLELATNNKSHFNSVRSSIGYLISSHKNPSLTKAIIYSDILSQLKNLPYGRSGKGLIIRAISNIINVIEYNGKATDLSKDRFVFQNIRIDTSLIVLQDVSSDFKFESLFSILTDQISIEKKHQTKIIIPFSQSPKVAITTNYTIPQDSDSYRDRKYLIALNNFFNADNKPEKYLKSNLFDWNKKEFLKFDSFVIGCIQLFLNKGLIEYKSLEHKRQILISKTSEQFLNTMNSEFCEIKKYYSLKEIANKLDLQIKDKSSKSRKTMSWIKLYSSYKEYSIDKRTVKGNREIIFYKN